MTPVFCAFDRLEGIHEFELFAALADEDRKQALRFLHLVRVDHRLFAGWDTPEQLYELIARIGK